MLDFKNWNSKTDRFYKTRKVLAFDLDDTLTTDSRLPHEIVEYFEKLQIAKIKVVIVTGRPAGWADALIKLLPLDGIVCENGAVIFSWKNGQLKKKKREAPQRFFFDLEKRTYELNQSQSSREKLLMIQIEILKKIPSVRVASDQFSRLYDLAIDFAEEVSPPLNFLEAQEIANIFLKQGAQAKVSSIHVNGWFGDFSKKSGLKFLVEKQWGLRFLENVAYVGDSPNDGSMFEAVDCSIGVANLKSFIGKVIFQSLNI